MGDLESFNIMANIKQKNKEKETAKEVKRFLNEKYPNLFIYLSDLEVKKQLSFSEWRFILPFKHPLNKYD
mgnify:CR=1 FL=1